MKRTKIQHLVMLVEKRNGRIAKNEQYSIDAFVSRILPNATISAPIRRAVPNVFQRLFRWKALEEDVWARATRHDRGLARRNIAVYINNDVVGRKKKK